MSIRVFLVDDELMILRGLEILLGREPSLQVCGRASTIAEALEGIAFHKPDVAILDLMLKEESGMDLIRLLSKQPSMPRIIVFSMETRRSSIRAALREGASGYVTKEDGTENLTRAIGVVMGGGRFLSDSIARRLLK